VTDHRTVTAVVDQHTRFNQPLCGLLSDTTVPYQRLIVGYQHTRRDEIIIDVSDIYYSYGFSRISDRAFTKNSESKTKRRQLITFPPGQVSTHITNNKT